VLVQFGLQLSRWFASQAFVKSLSQIHLRRERPYLLWLPALVLANVIVSEAAPIDEGLVDIKTIDPTIVVE
jgi:hypothetical protein